MDWKTELIMNGLKIVSMKIEHMLIADRTLHLLIKVRVASHTKRTESWLSAHYSMIPWE